MSEISVLLVDDRGLVRRGFRRILEDDPEIRVVDEAANGQETIRLARQLHRRVIVMDMAMPGLDGVQATRQIVKDEPNVAVLILTCIPRRTTCATLWTPARAAIC
jgi:DNA-binding NarL/FixJ family response regulator